MIALFYNKENILAKKWRCPVFLIFVFQDTYRDNAPSNTIQTQAITRSANMGIWVVDTLNQLFIRGSYTEIKLFQKTKLVAKLFSLW